MDAKRTSKSGRPRRRLRAVLLVLLALVCVAGAELAVCRVAAPEVYRAVTAPAAELARRAWAGLNGTAGQLAAWAAGLMPDPSISPSAAPTAEPPVNQLAGDPAIDERPPAQDPAVTEFTTRDGREILTGGVVDLTYYNQGEAPWADAPFGTDPISGYGCGPTAMAMAVSSLTDSQTDPAQMAQWTCENGCWAKGSGSYLSIVEKAAGAWGLQAEGWHAGTPDALREQLASGHLFVALMGPGHFTENGHFILLRGITLEGEILVADPNSRERSLAAWDPQLLLDELSRSTAHGAPLWRITPPATAGL